MLNKKILLFAASMLLASCGNPSTPASSNTGKDSSNPSSVEPDESYTEDESVSYDESEQSQMSQDITYHGGSQTIKIVFHVDARTTEGQAYKRRIDMFNAAYSSVGLRAAPTFKARTAGGTDYELQLIAAQLDGTLADIITFDAPNCASYADADLLYDITDKLSESEKKDFLSLNTYQNRVYGLPIQESSAGFFYNKKIFADAGIDVSGITVDNPWTFAQFKEVCAKLAKTGKTPVDMRLDATNDETATYLLYSFIHAAGGQFLSEDGLTSTGYFNSDASKKGFQFLKDLVDANYTSYAIGATDFFTGKVGMYLSSGWTIPDLDNKYPEQFPNRDSWGLLPYPCDVKRASATGSWSYAITNNGTKDKTGVLELLKWMASSDSSTAVTNATGMIPCRKSCNPAYQAGSPELVLYEQLAKTGLERPITIGYPQFTTVFSNVIYKMRDSDVNTTVDNAAKELQRQLDRI